MTAATVQSGMQKTYVSDKRLFDRGWKSITTDGKIGSKPDHDVRFKIRLFGKHRCGVPRIFKGFHMAVAVRRARNELFDGNCSLSILFAYCTEDWKLGRVFDVGLACGICAARKDDKCPDLRTPLACVDSLIYSAVAGDDS